MFLPSKLCTLGLIVCLPFAAAFGQENTAPSLPDIPQLMAQIVVHEKQVEQVRENYTYTALQTMQETDPKSGTKKTQTYELNNFYVNGYLIRRTIAEDGKLLTNQEREINDKRVAKAVKRCLKRPHREPVFEALGIRFSRMLDLVDASNLRREDFFHGRPTLVLDFVGRKDARTRNMDEKIVKSLRGVLWIDETDREVAHLEVTFDEDFRIGWGLLATIKKGTKLVVEQAPVADGLWLPTSYHMTMQGKYLVAGRLLAEGSERDYDFKRFNVESLQSKDLQLRPGASLNSSHLQ